MRARDPVHVKRRNLHISNTPTAHEFFVALDSDVCIFSFDTPLEMKVYKRRIGVHVVSLSREKFQRLVIAFLHYVALYCA